MANKWIRYWERTCPPTMQETDIERLPERFNKIKDFDPYETGMGLTIHGRTGTAKTRSVWMLLKILCEKGKGDHFFVTSTSFANKISWCYGRNEFNKEYNSYIRTCKLAKTLVFDDIGKERLTERVTTELFDLIDHRTNYKLPIIYTTNYVGDELLAKFPSKESGQPILRRMREFTESVNYK